MLACSKVVDAVIGAGAIIVSDRAYTFAVHHTAF